MLSTADVKTNSFNIRLIQTPSYSNGWSCWTCTFGILLDQKFWSWPNENGSFSKIERLSSESSPESASALETDWLNTFISLLQTRFQNLSSVTRSWVLFLEALRCCKSIEKTLNSDILFVFQKIKSTNFNFRKNELQSSTFHFYESWNSYFWFSEIRTRYPSSKSIQ